ncbi:ROK-family glucokinase [Cenarchaeum symbiosum A]|uniref:ROK-family glucokinase n=1 Tax=Cenarchaeum symbiosum (strain A) TaxID=414004 RepID=A0RZ39_CENSY|nr:ROK-family glucokinase [Cenarchaeum symbiosum A]
MNRIGIDLGGTKTEGVLLDEQYNILDRRRVPTSGTYDGVLDGIAGLVEGLDPGESTVGVCTPGSLSPSTGLIRNSNTRYLSGRPLKGDLEGLLGRPITMENDANCFALAEARMGAGRGYGTVFGVIMGTGVGGGLVVDGIIRGGRNGIAGEWGHHILHRDGRECYCGEKGCVEMYISGPALERRWAELTGRSEPLKEIMGGVHGSVKWRHEFMDNFGAGLANVIDILDPDVIVLGGGVSNVPLLYSEGRDAVYKRVFSDIVDTPILRNELGDSSGVIGACLL